MGNDLFNSNYKGINPHGYIICSRWISRKKYQKPMISSCAAEKKIPNSTETDPESTVKDDTMSKEKIDTECTVKDDTASKEKTDSESTVKDDTTSKELKLKFKERKQYLTAQNLRNHVRMVHPKPESKNSKQILTSAKQEMYYIHPRATMKVKNDIMPKIRDPMISTVARHDLLIILYANKYAEKHDGNDQDSYVRAHIRLMAKFFITLNKTNKDIDESIKMFHAKYWNDVVTAIKLVSDYNKDTNRFNIIYNAETLPLIIRKCFKIVRREYSEQEDEKNLENLTRFIYIFYDDIQNTISVKAFLSRKESNRHNSNKILPQSNDVATFREYLDIQRKDTLKTVKGNNLQYEEYTNILVLTGLLLQIFTRRRPGEVERTLLLDFTNIKKADPNSEFFKQLSAEEQEERLSFMRIDIQDKKVEGKGALYLNIEDYECLQLCIQNRNRLEIPNENKYLFALRSDKRGTIRHIKLYEAIVMWSNECSINYKKIDHKNIRGTALRKHGATKNGTIEKGAKTDLCAKAFGHTPREHIASYKRVVDEEDVEIVRLLKKIKDPEPVPQNEYKKHQNLSKNSDELDED